MHAYISIKITIKKCIFRSLGRWSNFDVGVDVGEYFYKKKLSKVKILTFEGEA